jgi:uncharacterized protein (TIGR02300 family)
VRLALDIGLAGLALGIEGGAPAEVLHTHFLFHENRPLNPFFIYDVAATANGKPFRFRTALSLGRPHHWAKGCRAFPPFLEVGSVAKPELGNKHQCQNCGVRFFDLNKSPIRCPKCGTVCQDAPLPRVAQHAAGSSLRAKSRFRTAAVAVDEEPPAGAETVLVSLDEADAGEDKVAVVADDDVEIEADETFLEEEEEEEDADDVGDLIDGQIGDEEER